MRRLVLASALFLSACATRPQQPETVSPPPVTAQPQQQTRGLIGMTPSDLMHHVDTRGPSGADYSQAACVTSLEYPS